MERLLLGVEALASLEKGGFPVLKNVLARDEDGAARAAAAMGYPVALKISSPDVIHKTETKGIRVHLRDGNEVRQAFREMVAAFKENFPDKRLEGALVQEMGRGFEMIVGVLMDQQFGPVLMFGLGGIFVEALRDVSFRYIPIEPGDAKEMIEELQGYRALKNPRNETVSLKGVENFLVQVSEFMKDHPGIEEMDLNPVFASSAGITICDARIKTREGFYLL